MSITFSNSTTKLWSFCKRAYYNNVLRDGKGYEGKYLDEDLLYGKVAHEVFPVLWSSTPGSVEIDHAITQASETLVTTFLADELWEAMLSPEMRQAKAEEWGRLLEGQMYGLLRHMLPYLQSCYNLVSAEGDAARRLEEWEEIGAGADPVELIAKPDTLLYGKDVSPVMEDAGVVPYPGLGYLEWKTVATPTPAWYRGWMRNPQAWTGAMCVKAALDLPIQWFMVCGLVKGTETEHADGVRRRGSPWCYAFRLPPNAPSAIAHDVMTTDGAKWKVAYTSGKGWVRVSTSTFPGGVKAWVAQVPMEIVQAQFVLTVPDDIDWELAEEWLDNQGPLVGATQRVKHCPEEWKTIFPRSLEKCETGQYGKPCGFRKLCFDPEVAAEPLMWYRVRVPHHALEQP